MSVRDEIAVHVMTYINSPALDASGRCLIEDIASDFRDTTLDHILGKSEPTPDDVREEAKRVFGPNVTVLSNADVVDVRQTEWGTRETFTVVLAPTIASTYAALRALPSKT